MVYRCGGGETGCHGGACGVSGAVMVMLWVLVAKKNPHRKRWGGGGAEILDGVDSCFMRTVPHLAKIQFIPHHPYYTPFPGKVQGGCGKQ